MNNPPLIKTFLNIPVNYSEIARYGGVPDFSMLPDGDKCLEDALQSISYKVCYRKTNVSVEGDIVKFDFASVHSTKLAINLKNANEAIIFAATLGQRMDFLIEKHARISPAKSLVFQAIGAERIEALCDIFCESVEEEFAKKTSPRFSPGYGDLSLDFQKEIFGFVEARRIGLTLNESLIMAPTKSVTAIAGFSGEGYNKHDCSLCPNVNCEYRKINK